MTYWRDKVVVVTGGSAGLGRAIVEVLAAAGATVVIVARGRDRLEELCDSLTSGATLPEKPEAIATSPSSGDDGRRADLLPVLADVTLQEDADRIVREAMDWFGRIDLLVNCAGRSTREAVLDTTPQAFQELWELNLLATVRMTRACAPALLESRGHLVNIGSLAGKIAGPFLGAYPATKHALTAYTQQLRLELAPSGLHVLLVSTGPIAREDGGKRYGDQANVPAAAQRPGGGAKVAALDPHRLASDILHACEKRQVELVRPRKARLLLAAAAVSPRLGDWLVRRFTGG